MKQGLKVQEEEGDEKEKGIIGCVVPSQGSNVHWHAKIFTRTGKKFMCMHGSFGVQVNDK